MPVSDRGMTISNMQAVHYTDHNTKPKPKPRPTVMGSATYNNTKPGAKPRPTVLRSATYNNTMAKPFSTVMNYNNSFAGVRNQIANGEPVKVPRNRAMMGQDSDIDEPDEDDYLSLRPVSPPSVSPRNSTTADYEEPMPSASCFQPSSTLL